MTGSERWEEPPKPIVESDSTPRICTDVQVHGDVSGQLAVGENIVQMRIDRLVGNVVTILPVGDRPRITERPRPISVLPRAPELMVDRHDETDDLMSEVADSRAVEVIGDSGIGKSTLLRHLAHRPGIAQAGGVAHLSVRDHSRDDLLQTLFEVFYSSDIPVKPSSVELHHRLQHVRATLLLDDVDLSSDDVHDVADAAPRCAVVVASKRAAYIGRARPVHLDGLPPDAAEELFVDALGHEPVAEDRPAVGELCSRAGGVPGRLLQVAAEARRFTGSLHAYVAGLPVAGIPRLEPDSPDDMRLLGLLAAIPGVRLSASQLSAMSGLEDVFGRLDRWRRLGLVTTSPSAGGSPTFGLTSGIELEPGPWQLDQRRAELHAYFTDWAQREPDTVLEPGAPVETVSAVQADASRRGRWRTVLALAVLLEAAFALGGRWDAWRDVARSALEAARALGDARAEAMELHQLGTHALCGDDLGTAAELLRDALDRRTTLGDTAAAEATRHNLSLIELPPVLPPDDSADRAADLSGGLQRILARVPAPLKIFAALVPIIGALLFIGTSQASVPIPQVEPKSLQFSPQPLSHTSRAQTVALENPGGRPIVVDRSDIGGIGLEHFTVASSTCPAEIPAGGRCTTNVVFTPTGTGDHRASLTWDIRDMPDDPVSTLTGTGTAPDPGSPRAEPNVLRFGDQTVATTSTGRPVRFLPPTATRLDIRSVSITGVNSSDFVVDDDRCSGVRVAAGAACTTSVRFAPRAAGTRRAVLTVTGPGDVAVAVPLVGDAVGAPRTPPVSGVEAAGVPPAVDAPPVGVPPAAVPPGAAPAAGAPSVAAPTVAAPTAGVPFIGVPPAGVPPGRPPLAGAPLGGAPFVGVPTAEVPPGEVPPTGAPRMAGPTASVPFVSEPTAEVPLGIMQRKEAPLAGAPPAALPPAPRGEPPKVQPLKVQPPEVQPPEVQPPEEKPPEEKPPGPILVRVPDLVGDTRDQAQQELAAVPLSMGAVSTRPDSTIGRDRVILSKPEGGALAEQGAPVDIVLSTGPVRPAPIDVPDVVGKPLDTAQAIVTKAGLTPVTGEPVTDAVIAEGSVSSSNPEAGASVPPGTSVTLRPSSGPALVRVPDVVGKPLDTAQAMVTKAGLTPVTGNPVTDAVIAEGSVSSSNPEAGASVPPGTSVTLRPSSGPALMKVPDVVGNPLPCAQMQVTNVGLKPVADSSDREPSLRRKS